MAMQLNKQLPLPADLKAEYPLSREITGVKARRDAEIRDIFTGRSDKFVVIVGPARPTTRTRSATMCRGWLPSTTGFPTVSCSSPASTRTSPGTTGEGYKGMLHQPEPDKAPDLLAGIIAIRRMHTRAIMESGLTSADEMLYPENRSYLDDLLSYEAVGARSVENQQHRLTASGMDIPWG